MPSCVSGVQRALNKSLPFFLAKASRLLFSSFDNRQMSSSTDDSLSFQLRSDSVLNPHRATLPKSPVIFAVACKAWFTKQVLCWWLVFIFGMNLVVLVTSLGNVLLFNDVTVQKKNH